MPALLALLLLATENTSQVTAFGPLPAGTEELNAEEKQLLTDVRLGIQTAEDKYLRLTLRGTADGYRTAGGNELVHQYTTQLVYRRLSPFRVRVDGDTTSHTTDQNTRAGIYLRDGEACWQLQRDGDTGKFYVSDAGRRALGQPYDALERLTWFATAAVRWRHESAQPAPLRASQRSRLLAVNTVGNETENVLVEFREQRQPLHEGADPAIPIRDNIFRYRAIRNMYLLDSVECYSRAIGSPVEYRSSQVCEYAGDSETLSKVVFERAHRELPDSEFAVYQRDVVIVNEVVFAPPAKVDMAIGTLVDVAQRRGLSRLDVKKRQPWLYAVNALALLALLLMFWLRRRQAIESDT